MPRATLKTPTEIGKKSVNEVDFAFLHSKLKIKFQGTQRDKGGGLAFSFLFFGKAAAAKERPKTPRRKSTSTKISKAEKQLTQTKQSRLVRGDKFNDEITLSNILSVEEVLTCVKIIAETFACLPVSLKQIKNGRIQTVNEHPIAQLLRRKVNPYTTAYEWKQWVAIDYLTANFGFSLLSRNGANGDISGIWQQNAKDVKAFRSEDNFELYYGVALDSLGESVDFKYTEAFRFINFNNSGILGNNITELARNTLRAVNATTKFARDFYEQGIFPDGFIEWSAEIQDENTGETAREVLKNDLREKYAGTGKFHQALLLPSGAKWVQVQNDLQKLQAVETRKFNRQIVASMFRVSPFLMGESGGDWEGQIKNMLPMIVNFESAAAMCLLSEEEQREGYFFKMNVDALERGNLSTYTSALSTAVNNGLMTDNEAREKIDLPPVEGGDELRVNSALQSPAHSKNAGGQNEYSEGKENA